MGGIGKNDSVIYALLSIAFVLFIAIFGLKDCKKEDIVYPDTIEDDLFKPEEVKLNKYKGKTVETRDIEELTNLFKQLDKVYVMGESTLSDDRYVPTQRYKYPVKYVQIKKNGDLYLYDENMHILDVFKIKKEQTDFDMQSLDVRLNYHHKKYDNVEITFIISEDEIRMIKYILSISIKLNNDLSLWMNKEFKYN